MLARGLAIAVIVVILDQLSKAAILGHFAASAYEGERLTSFFNLVLVYNRGVSFGMFNSGADSGAAANALLFSIAAGLIVVGLVYWLRRVTSPLLAVAIGLIIGGAVGNVVDRIRLGAVVDFLDFHIGSWHWPAFNLADSAICVGVAAMLLDGLLLHREAR